MSTLRKSLLQESSTTVVVTGLTLFLMGVFGAQAWSREDQDAPTLAVTAAAALLVLATAAYRLRNRLRITAVLEQQLGELARAVGDQVELLTPVLDKSPAGSGWNRLIRHKQLEAVDRGVERRLTQATSGGGNERFARALRSIPDGIAITDRLGKLGYANPAWSALLGTESDDGNGQAILDLLAPREFSNWEEVYPRLLEGTKPISVELYCGGSVADGVLQLARSPLEGRATESEGYVWIVRNITQSALAREAHEQFLAAATHELRTPLTNIRAYTESLLETENISQNRQQEFFNIIHTEAGRLGRLLNQLLDIQQLEAGSMTIAANPFDIRRMLQEVQEYIAPLVEEKKLTFSCRVAPDIKNIEADKEKVISCLINLLGNAIKYTPEGGEVRLVAEQQEGGVSIHVEDTGIGISEEDLPKIFDRFYRAQDERIIDIEGNGLGLAFALEVARLHNGELKVESKLNEGSRFTLQFPSRSLQAG